MITARRLPSTNASCSIPSPRTAVSSSIVRRSPSSLRSLARRDAVAAAADAQRGLTGAVRARMGLHTGQPQVAGDRYLGLDVSRAARIGAAAHGGQALLSQATRDLVEDELPEGVSLRDLGEHRLKDLTSAQRLSQIVVAGLSDEFPPLRTLENRPTNLPVQPTPLIGREVELAAVAELVSRADVRLVTLTGPGGCGKTRLALQAAAELVEEFPHGVYFVALEPIADIALVLPTIAQTVGLRESGGASLADRLKDLLADKRLLLVLDNVEQLVDAAPELAKLLATAPELKLLVTSRTPLNLSGEHDFSVPSLSLPDLAHLPELASISQYEAVALFVDRARAVKADFAVTSANAPAVAEMCVRLDGLPLAIELAASRAKLLSPQALLARLEQRFDLLVGGPRDMPARQQTLRATIDWSYGLLGRDEQTLLARLAVFVGGCTLEAVEAVCGGEGLLTGLTTLIDSNLLRQEEQPDGEPRFTMLESIRAYSLDLLEASGEAEDVRRRHADHFVSVAGRIEDDVRTKPDVDWLALEREHDNFRAALNWLSAHDEHESLVQLTAGLVRFWERRGHVAEGKSWSDIGLTLAPQLPAALEAQVWLTAASLVWHLEEYQQSREFALCALALFRQIGDRYYEARLSRRRLDRRMAGGRLRRGRFACRRSEGDLPRARRTRHTSAPNHPQSRPVGDRARRPASGAGVPGGKPEGFTRVRLGSANGKRRGRPRHPRALRAPLRRCRSPVRRKPRKRTPDRVAHQHRLLPARTWLRRCRERRDRRCGATLRCRRGSGGADWRADTALCEASVR